MLTKEECDNALDRVARFCSWFSPYECPECIKLKNELDILDKLIEEHFSNPPLKFDELEENMWVWDNKRKVKLLIAYCYSEDDMGYYNLSNPEDYKYIHIEFEENRFFRKEVQE